jgi:hypothetical protein
MASTNDDNQILDEEDNISKRDPKPFGAMSIGGSETIPEADDDTEANMKELGFYTDADDEHPKELNLEAELDKADEAGQ